VWWPVGRTRWFFLPVACPRFLQVIRDAKQYKDPSELTRIIKLHDEAQQH
jgi:hypothetical protein